MARQRTVTNYHVLSDNVPLRVALNARKASTAKPFTPPDDMIMDDSGMNKPMLSYEVDASGGGLTTFSVSVITLNGVEKKIDSHTIGGDSRTYFEPFPASLIRGDRKFNWTLDDGVELKISSIVVWFNRLIDV